jgi:hypothetical protein
MCFSTIAKELVFLLLCTPLLLSQRTTEEPGGAQMLEARAAIESLKYCQGDPHTFTVYLKLRLALVNKSRSPVIVSRRVKIPAVRVSKSADDATAGRFVYDPAPYDISVVPLKPVKFRSKPSSEIFVILKPGEKFEVSQWTGVLADLSGSPAAGSGIISGKYVAQAVINTWPYPNNPARETVEAWGSFGRLANEVIKTTLFEATFPVVRTAPSCRSFSAPK